MPLNDPNVARAIDLANKLKTSEGLAYEQALNYLICLFQRQPLDNCEVCHGAKGGVLGNENIVNGVVMCDYCTVEAHKE